MTPSSEVITWFGWHDGAGGTGQPSEAIELVPGGEFYDLGYLIGAYRQTSAVAAKVASTPGDGLSAADLWRSSWFPLLRLFGKGYLAVDLTESRTAASAVHIVWHDDDPADRARPVWPTLCSFVEGVIRRYEAGVYLVRDDGFLEGPTLDR